MELQNKRILLIDDNKIDNEINEKLLRKKGGFQNIVTKESGGSALEYLKSVPTNEIPDIILLDVHMPEMNGFDFLEAFQLLPESILRTAKIYMLTSSRDHSDHEKANQHAYVHQILTKPLQVNLITN